MEIDIHEFTIGDYDRAIQLWRSSEGIGLSAADERDRIDIYLQRNPGLSFTAWHGKEMVGAVLGGHDGRRGFLHHLAVHPNYRKQGIGNALVDRCHRALCDIGIDKVHIFVLKQNRTAITFWMRKNYHLREDLVLLSVNIL